jgi:hypothetical protein
MVSLAQYPRHKYTKKNIKGEALLWERICRIEDHGRLHSHAPPLRADDDGQ